MRNTTSFFTVGILFGIVMTKSEAISWFRIHEMFRFESFHMYGIIGVAVILSAVIIGVMKAFKIKTWAGTEVTLKTLDLKVSRHLWAGTIFGLGWALMGACPGPMFVMLGHGFWIFLLMIISAVLGTYTYGLVKSKLPH